MERTTTSYQRTKNRVRHIKGFHAHLSMYIVINLGLVFIKMHFLGIFDVDGTMDVALFSWAYLDIAIMPIAWGIALLIHATKVFRFKLGFMGKWEERQLKKIMEPKEV